MGLPVPYQVNSDIPADTKKAAYSNGVVILSEPMFRLIAGAIEDGDSDELRRIAEKIEVVGFPPAPTVCGLLGLPVVNPQKYLDRYQ